MAHSSWCFYDIPNENIIFLEEDTQMPTEEELSRSVIKMPLEQAALIRRAKGLPMPCPPVDVQVIDKDGNITYDSREERKDRVIGGEGQNAIIELNLPQEDTEDE